jgi:hypothetical protein
MANVPVSQVTRQTSQSVTATPAENGVSTNLRTQIQTALVIGTMNPTYNPNVGYQENEKLVYIDGKSTGLMSY